MLGRDPAKNQITATWVCSWDPGPPQDGQQNHQISSLFPRHKKHANSFQGKQKTTKLDLKTYRIPTSVKSCFLHSLLHQILVFKIHTTQFRPEYRAKTQRKQAWTKNTNDDPKRVKGFQNGVPKSDSEPQGGISAAPMAPKEPPASKMVTRGLKIQAQGLSNNITHQENNSIRSGHDE